MAFTHKELDNYLSALELQANFVWTIEEALRWHPISEVAVDALGRWVELRGPHMPPVIIHAENVEYVGYTHFRCILPGPEGCV